MYSLPVDTQKHIYDPDTHFDGVFLQKIVKRKAPPLLFNRALLNMPLKHEVAFGNCSKLKTRKNDVNDLLLVLLCMFRAISLVFLCLKVIHCA